LLLEKGALLNASTKEGNIPLIIAAMKGHKEVSELLIARHAQIDARDAEGYTALHRAAFNGHAEMCQMLINHGTHIDGEDVGAPTPLFLAAQNGHEGVARLLLNQRASVERCTSSQVTPLHCALLNGHTALSLALIAHNAPLEARLARDYCIRDMLFGECTPLHVAAYKNDLGAIKALVEKRADMNACDQSGSTVLERARQAGKSELVAFLVAAKTAVLLSAIELGDNNKVVVLIAANGYSVEELLTALVFARQIGNHYLALWIIHRGLVPLDTLCMLKFGLC
jgi:ankyrin repeat protein